MVPRYREARALDVRSKREHGTHHCQTFPFGSQVSSFNIIDRMKPVSHGPPAGWVVVFLLLERRHADLVSQRVRVEKEEPVRNRNCQDRWFDESVIQHEKRLPLFARRIFPRRVDVLLQPTVQG